MSLKHRLNSHNIIIKKCVIMFKNSYLDFRKSNLFGHDTKRNIISIVNHALHIHSMKKKASWALVSYLSSVHPIVWFEVDTVMFFIRGTLISGWVLMQKETIETTMKKTDITPMTCKKEKNDILCENNIYQGFYYFLLILIII